MSNWLALSEVPEWTSHWVWLRITTEGRQYVYYQPRFIDQLGEHGVCMDNKFLEPEVHSVMIIEKPKP